MPACAASFETSSNQKSQFQRGMSDQLRWISWPGKIGSDLDKKLRWSDVLEKSLTDGEKISKTSTPCVFVSLATICLEEVSLFHFFCTQGGSLCLYAREGDSQEIVFELSAAVVQRSTKNWYFLVRGKGATQKIPKKLFPNCLQHSSAPTHSLVLSSVAFLQIS